MENPQKKSPQDARTAALEGAGGTQYPQISSKSSRQKRSPRKEFIEQNRLRLGFERRLRSQLQSTFTRVGRDAARAYQRSGNVDTVSRGLTNRLADVLGSHYRAVIDAFGLRVIRDRKQDGQFEAIVRQYIRDVGGIRITQISNSTMRQINRVVNQGVQEGLGVAAIGKNIRDSVDGSFSRYRANTIARTETHSAASYANHQVNASLNIPNQMNRWVSVSDARARATHVAANGTEVPLDEDFVVGGVAMAYTGDPKGGAKNVINCRCVTLYIDPDDEVIQDEDTVAPQKPIREPLPERNVTSPIEPAVTLLNFKMMTRLQAQKSLTAEFAEAAQDDRYLNKKIRHYRGRTPNDFGKAKFTKDFDDVSVAVIAGIKPELDELADRFNVPRLRGFKSGIGAYGANQGDGVMQINPRTINRDTAGILTTRLTDQERTRKLNELAEEESKRDSQIANAKEENVDIYIKYDQDLYALRVAARRGDSEASADLDRYEKNRKLIERLRGEQAVITRTRQSLNNANDREVSTWDTSKPQSEKPRFADAYLNTGFERVRQLLYHEMGHHIHENIRLRAVQSFNDGGGAFEPNPRQVVKPVEEYLTANRNKFINPEGKKRQYSTYAQTNPYEWFAENFSSYWMGTRDKVDPVFVELIEKLLTDKDFVESL